MAVLITCDGIDGQCLHTVYAKQTDDIVLGKIIRIDPADKLGLLFITAS